AFGNDPIDWQASAASGGSPGRDNLPSANPVVDAGLDAALNQSDSFSQAVNFTDSPIDLGQIYTATVIWGDGSPNTIYTNVTTGFVISHLFQGHGQFTVRVTVSDDAGGSGFDTLLANVNDNVPPTSSPAQF